MWAISKISVPSWIENLNPRSIWRKDLVRITEVAQDMRARDEWLWEYVRCDECWEIFSKEEIFWHLRRDLRILTVAKIEEALWWEKPNCPICHWKTLPVFDRNKYIDEIRERYSLSVDSFLTVYRDSKWDIRWFFDWYLDNFENIYRREFEDYYSCYWVEWIKRVIRKNYWIELPEVILLCSALWMDEWSKNFNILYELIRQFFLRIYIEYWWGVFWMAESTLWSNTHSIYHSVWAQRVWILELWWWKNHKIWWKENDLFIHPMITADYFSKLKIWPREFLRENSRKMKEVKTA